MWSDTRDDLSIAIAEEGWTLVGGDPVTVHQELVAVQSLPSHAIVCPRAMGTVSVMKSPTDGLKMKCCLAFKP
jgi:hypothetical protein